MITADDAKALFEEAEEMDVVIKKKIEEMEEDIVTRAKAGYRNLRVEEGFSQNDAELISLRLVHRGFKTNTSIMDAEGDEWRLEILW